MKEMLLKDVKVGQGFYEKETGFYYNRVTVTIPEGIGGYFEDGGFIPTINGKYDVEFMKDTTTVVIDDF